MGKQLMQLLLISNNEYTWECICSVPGKMISQIKVGMRVINWGWTAVSI